MKQVPDLGCSLATLSLLEKSSLFIHQRSGENPKDHGSVPPGYSNGVDLETRIGIYRENESEHMCMTSCMYKNEKKNTIEPIS